MRTSPTLAMSEQRAAQRVTVCLPIALEPSPAVPWQQAQHEDTHLTDLSATGARVRLCSPIDSGTEVYFAIPGAADDDNATPAFCGSARIVRVERDSQGCHAAMRFSQPLSDSGAWRAFVNGFALAQ